MPDPRLIYKWNARAAQYVTPNGQFVSRRAVREALDRALAAETRAMMARMVQLRAGQIDLDAWFVQMRQSIKLMHLWSASAANGGWIQLDATDYGRVGGIVRFHYTRLQRFAEQIAQGLPLDGRALARVRMYANAGRQTYHAIEAQVVRVAGFTQERNILHPTAEHCAQCAILAELGWVPLGTLPRIGTRTCLTACQCHIEYR